MYNDIVTRIPADEDEMWGLLWEQFEYVRHVLWELPVESKEDALSNKYHRKFDGKAQRNGMLVIRYRNASGELGQREHFLKMGRDLLPYVHQVLDERALTPEFVQQWGKIMFCHGYIASYVFDDTDDMFGERNRRKGASASNRTPQRVFLARLLLWFIDTQKQTPQQAEASSAKAIRAFINSGQSSQLPAGYDVAWLQTLLFQGKDADRIVSTMSQKNKSEDELRKLAAVKIEELPPIELLVPATRP